MATLLGGPACQREGARKEAVPLDAGWVEGVQASFPCVHFSELERFLPRTLAGFRTVRENASTGKYGEVSVSEAERVFAQDDRELSVRLVDTTLKGKLAQAIQSLAEQTAERERSRLQGTVPPSGAPESPSLIRLDHAIGYVRYDPNEGKAEANLLVGNRFIVSVTSSGMRDSSEARRVATSLDLAGLSGLRAATSKE